MANPTALIALIALIALYDHASYYSNYRTSWAYASCWSQIACVAKACWT